MNYPATGGFPEALVKILLTIMERTSLGGATKEELKDAYRETRGTVPTDKTIYRAIRRLNLIFDPLAYGETKENNGTAEPEKEEIDLFPPVIQTRRHRGTSRYIFTGDFPGSSIDANHALLLTLGLYTQQKGLLKNHFETVIGELMRDLLDRINSYSSLFRELKRHVHVSGYGPSDPERNIIKIKEIMRAVRGCRRI